MSMLPDQLGLLAEFLKNSTSLNIDKESFRRASAGRFYYKLFHIADKFLALNYTKEYKDSGGGTHQALQTCCTFIDESLNDSDFEKLAIKLHILHGLRVKADYHLHAEFTQGDLITMETETKRACALIEKIINKYSIKSA